MYMCTITEKVKLENPDLTTSNLVLNLWTTDRRRLMERQMPIQQSIQTAWFSAKYVVPLTAIQPLSKRCICSFQGCINLQPKQSPANMSKWLHCDT